MIQEYEENIRRLVERRNVLQEECGRVGATTRYQLRRRIRQLNRMIYDGSQAVQQMREYEEARWQREEKSSGREA